MKEGEEPVSAPKTAESVSEISSLPPVLFRKGRTVSYGRFFEAEPAFTRLTWNKFHGLS
jgi:hypothetical protein